MSKLGDALGFPKEPKAFSADEGDASDSEDAPASSKAKPDDKSGSAEMLAMKQFERASSTEAKVQAMKDFIEACGSY